MKSESKETSFANSTQFKPASVKNMDEKSVAMEESQCLSNFENNLNTLYLEKSKFK